MAYKTQPFSLKALTRVFEIDDNQMIRSRPSFLAWSAEDQHEHLSNITVRSTGNRLRGNVDILVDGQVAFSWENVLWPQAKKKMLERLVEEAKAKQAATPRQEESSGVRKVQEAEPRPSGSRPASPPKRRRVSGPTI